jgi:hypothetical protein
MAKNLPAYVLRDCTLFVDAESQIGQTDEIVLPVLEVKSEEMRNGGMIKPRRIHMGYNTTDASFTFTSFDPALIALFGLEAGKEIPIIAYGYFQDEDGAEHEGRAEMRGFFTKNDAGTWKAGDVASNSTEFTAHAYRIFMDDEEILSVDDFDVKRNGVSERPGRRAALRFD